MTLVENFGELRVPDTHSPFVPYFCLCVISPYTNYHFLVFEYCKGFFDRKVHGKPRVHFGSMSRRISAIENILVELSCKITSKSMNLGRIYLHFEFKSIKHLHTLFTILLQIFVFFGIWVRTMSKSKYRSWLITTGEVGRVNFDHIRQFKWVKLLINRNS